MLDASFEVWFKKDSLWAAEGIEAVFDRDPKRVCILQGPAAAKWSVVEDEPVKELLGNINFSLIQRHLERKYGGDAPKVPTIDYLAAKPNTVPFDLAGVQRTQGDEEVTFQFGSTLPEASAWLEN